MTTNSKRHVGVIGGGVMGGDVAILFASSGWDVHVMSPSPNTRAALAARVTAGLAKLGVAMGTAGQVTTCGTLAELPWDRIELVNESALEDLPLKQKLFAEMEQLARPGIPLTSNSSNFPISEITKGLATRSRMAGLHFFMPAHFVPLVEIVSGPDTDPAMAQSLIDLMRVLGKAPIHVKRDVPGFVGNRLQHALLREAMYLVADGVATPDDIDAAVRCGFGFRFIACGPMRQKEMSGWNTTLTVASALYPHLHNETTPPAWLGEMVKAGHTGMKAHQGLRSWTDAEIDEERTRIENALQAAMRILDAEKPAR
jgi:3-hydroxybutyryl-CoA dehydrogenase